MTIKEFLANHPTTPQEVFVYVRQEQEVLQRSTKEARYIFEAAMNMWPVKYAGIEIQPNENRILEMCVSCYLYGFYVANESFQDTIEVHSEKYRGQTITIGGDSNAI